MYGIFIYTYHQFKANVSKSTSPMGVLGNKEPTGTTDMGLRKMFWGSQASIIRRKIDRTLARE